MPFISAFSTHIVQRRYIGLSSCLRIVKAGQTLIDRLRIVMYGKALRLRWVILADRQDIAHMNVLYLLPLSLKHKMMRQRFVIVHF
mmetsp:Transcript_4786/g.7244  ORF Transcript_4786/g.7244 Transcript_4786/m.7244 type:complete len:86 (+) Transcript_4786:701-958(+)